MLCRNKCMNIDRCCWLAFDQSPPSNFNSGNGLELETIEDGAQDQRAPLALNHFTATSG